MPDLHGWITQRIDETEATAHACTATDWRHVFDGIIVDRDTDGWRSAPDAAHIATAAYDPDADHIAAHSPDTVLRRCEADRRILARHRLNPDAYWSEAAACHGCGVMGDCDDPVTDNLNDCPELLDLGHAHGLTAEVLAGLDRPQRGERPEPVAFRIGPSARPTSSVPPTLRGPNWKP